MMVQGFRKLAVTGGGSEPTLKGTRLSLNSSLHQTSTGIQSLDLIVGNGINLSSSLLIQEKERGEYTPLFAKHFVSEGISHDHVIICIGERVTSWLQTLPKPVQQQSRTDNDAPEDLKIAWRYKRKIQDRFSHSYDLSQHRSSAETNNCHVLSNYTSCAQIISFIEKIVNENEGNVIRVVLDRPMFPVLDEGLFSRFQYMLKRLTARSNVVMLAVYPTDTLSESLQFHLTQHYNYVLAVESLPRDDKSVYKDYHGILHLVKIDNMCTFTMPLYDLSDRFFKIKRKKFIIEKFFLPPDLSETVSRSSSNSSSCGSSNALDF